MSGVTDPASPYFKDGQWGWDGTVWRKLPMVWGYSGRWAEHQEDLNATVTYDSLTFTAVPPGEVWVLQAVDAWDVNSDPSRIQFSVTGDGVTTRLQHTLTPGISIPVYWTGTVVLKEGDRVLVGFYGTVAGDDLHANVRGYKMAIAE